MSHAYGQVLFPDGLIMHFEYDGTGDWCLPNLRDTAEEVNEHWRNEFDFSYCTCGKDEPVILACDYGNGYSWPGRACRHCRAIGEGKYYFEYDGEDLTDTLPEWWVPWSKEDNPDA